MALPRWTTPAGNLGIVPEQQFYDYLLQANDPSGGTLKYFHVSGKLPLGIQVIEAGKLQGVPVSEAGGDQNVEYTFTIRVKNEIDFVGSINGTTLTVTSVGTGALDVGQTLERQGILPRTKIIELLSGTGGVGTYKINQPQSLASGEFIATSGISDRTFRLTVTNIAPPIIFSPERNSGLGIYLDGSEVDIWFEALEFTPGIELQWEFVKGELPPGLSFSEVGRITGFIYPIISTEPGTTPGWDASVWSLRGWDFPLVAISKTFTFTVQVSDGIKYDQSTYSILVIPRSALRTDNDILTIDRDSLGSDIRFTIDAGEFHAPIITSTQSEFLPARQGSFFSFNLEAVDVDNDIVWWTFADAVSGGFDEQDTLFNYNYVPARLIGGKLIEGAFPRASSSLVNPSESESTLDFTNVNFLPGAQLKVLNSQNLFEIATVDDTATIKLTGNSIPNISVGDYLTQVSSSANAEVISYGSTTGTIALRGNIIYGNIFIEKQTFQIITTGNLSANVGAYLTQPSLSANAVITSRPGFLSLLDIPTLANISAGDIINQTSTGANAYVLQTPDIFASSNLFYVNYTNSFAFNLGSGNVQYIRNGIATSISTYPVTANVISNIVNVQGIQNRLLPATGNVLVNGVNGLTDIAQVIKDPQQITFNSNIGDIITQVGAAGNATVIGEILDDIKFPVIFTETSFNDYAGNVIINGTDANVWITGLEIQSAPFVFSAEAGDYITQPSTGANALVTRDLISGNVVSVEFLSNTFVTNTGNLQLNGANITAFPSVIIANTDVAIDYTTSATFDINFSESTGQVLANGNNTFANVTAIKDIGIILTGSLDEGTVGFDEGRYDQGDLALPAGITINPQTGWITGRLPTQTVNLKEYTFEVIAYKRDNTIYRDTQLFTITVLGDINNRIDWLVPNFLGNIQNGKVSDLYVAARHFTDATPKTLIYTLKPNNKKKLPQGLALLSTGLIVGRVSFQIFLLDSGETTIDGGKTTFDETYTFVVEAKDPDNTIVSERTFTIRVIGANITPYENLYLRALPNQTQRNIFSQLTQTSDIFPNDLIYRKEDPWFGVAKNLRLLFLPGLNPSTLSEYALAAQENHFRKQLKFGEIKTARALDSNFNVKYEVVYVDIIDENTNAFGQGPADVIDLTAQLMNPYYTRDGNSYEIAYPNAFSNMQSKMANEIDYANKGALPDWMTSRQTNGRVLGFTRAVVLAYCNPGASGIVAFRLRQSGFAFNELDFTVDRYQLDNAYSKFYNLDTDQFNLSLETTFDRYPTLPSSYLDAGIIDYAVSDPFEFIHNRSLDLIRSGRNVGGLGGLDGVKNIKDGDLLVFAEQEFAIPGLEGDYNAGWSRISTVWDSETWDDDQGTVITTDDQGWDSADYVPGFIENNFDPTVPNQRIGIWRVNINNGIVTLSFVQTMNYFDKLYVRNGRTYGGTNIFYDPTVKENKNYANYTLIVQEIKVAYTTFDGNSTRFYDNRDEYIVPGEGDKYIKFAHTGVFT